MGGDSQGIGTSVTGPDNTRADLTQKSIVGAAEHLRDTGGMDNPQAIKEFDAGAVAGGLVGLMSPLPIAAGVKIGQKLDWKEQYTYDPLAADKLATDTLAGFDRDGDSDGYKALETEIREAKETASLVPKAKTPEELAAEEAAKAQAAADERLSRLSSGRSGLLWQDDESGVPQKLGG